MITIIFSNLTKKINLCLFNTVNIKYCKVIILNNLMLNIVFFFAANLSKFKNFYNDLTQAN